MPLIFKVGLADDLFHMDNHRLTLAADLLHPTDNLERMNFGLEYGFYDQIFLRSGYRANSDLGNWSESLVAVCYSNRDLRQTCDIRGQGQAGHC